VRLGDYLDRIGVKPPLPPTAETLRRLHVAHLAAFPFENLTIQRHQPVLVDLDSIERKFLGGAGGYCFEHNTLFAAVLRELGFEVMTLMARVGTSESRALSHMLLRVMVEGEPWIADVGFGGEGLLEPVPLRENARVMQYGIEYSLRRASLFWTLSMTCGGKTEDMYEFGDAPHTPGDVEMANHYTSTHPSSNFRRTLTIQRVTPDERIILRTRMVTRYRNGERLDTPIDPSQVRTLARELFDIDLGTAPLLFEEI
jgi:N-hydroxyarylamine O-acetyltransferase